MTRPTRLTLPGTLPGLLTTGSPIRLAHDVPHGMKALGLHPHPEGSRGLVFAQTTGDHGPVVVLGMGNVIPIACEDLSLDLETSAGLHRAACWLLARKASEHAPDPEAMPGWCVGWGYEGKHNWVLSGLGGVWGFTGWPDASLNQTDVPWQAVPSLRMASPDLRPLEDGTPYRDADALRRACLHVAGVRDV